MAEKESLRDLTLNLKRSFERWEYLNEHGGSDPFWSDGVNMNLVRNHILYYKNKIEEYIRTQESEPSLFGSEYPDIYYKETPNLVSKDYMAKADEIRQRAREQLGLYEQDENFCYVRDNFSNVFPKGQTKLTRAHSLPFYAAAGLSAYRRYVEEDDLIGMRRSFYKPYEEKAQDWAKYAEQFKAFLSQDHEASQYESESEYEDDYYDDLEIDEFDNEPPAVTKEKPSLDSIIQNASQKAERQPKPKQEIDIQLSLF